MKQLPRFTDITLVLTEQCNLRCSYCYVPKEAPGGRTMTEEVALAAVDRFLDRAPSGKELSISFFGGEPFLARELMERVIDHARKRRPEGLTFSAPTNGTLLDKEAMDLVRRSEMSLALSVDGTTSSADRPDRQGRGTRDRLDALIPRMQDLSPIGRMTVTPDNVAQLCENVRALFEQGLVRIMHQPALELPWPREAVDRWGQQHRLLADWACERYAQHQPLPDLTVLEGIISRLCGSGMSYCGAGVTQAAVDPDGDVFGCFRSVSDPRSEHLVLGSVLGGPVNEPLIRAYARLDPRRAKPQDRDSCKGCEARDGCTVYCAAMGHVGHGDLRAVSHDACELMRIQVDVCRDILRRMRRLERASRRRASAQVAAAALALSLGVGVGGCDTDRTLKPDSNTDSAIKDKGTPEGPGMCPLEGGQKDSAPGLCPDLGKDLMGPGLCPKPIDGMKPGVCPPPPPDGMKPGLCPPPPPPDAMTPGLCPKPMDQGPPKPGYCPFKPDKGTPKPMEGGIGPGVCPFKVDQGTPKPGVCPVFPDTGIKKDAGKPTPGVCPMPAKDMGKPSPGLCPVPAPDMGKPKPGLC